jgi:hypothetical protein
MIGSRLTADMKDLLDLLKTVKSAIGEMAFSLMVLGLAVNEFGEKVFGNNGPHHPDLVRVASSVPFVAGLTIGLFRMLSPYFRTGPGRGLSDGLLAGVVAGLLGGYFGFGWHTDGYVEGPLTRTLLCLVFATPLGGVIGMFLSAFRPDTKIVWREHFGGFACAMAFCFATYGYALTRLVPAMEGQGIKFSDIELIFEVYLCFIASVFAFQSGWRRRKWLARMILLLICVFTLRLGAALCLAPDRQRPLSQWEYTDDSDESALGLTVAIGSCLVIGLAALALRDNRLSLRVDKWTDAVLHSYPQISADHQTEIEP